MSYLPHQIRAAKALIPILKEKGIALLFGAPRAGKTATALYVCEQSKAKKILVITKKNAIPGWHSEIKRSGASKDYTVINYEAAKKHQPIYDFAIVDESHNIGRPGKATQRFKDVQRLTKSVPVLISTGTPMTETPLSAYYQFALSAKTPFRFKNFYLFFRVYGEPNQIYANGRMIEQYNKAKPEVLEVVAPYTVNMSQDDAGIKHQAQDKVHIVPLELRTIGWIDELMEEGVVTLRGQEVVCDSDIGVRSAIHQIESGAIKLEGKLLELTNMEVVDYIKKTFGDKPSIGLMCHYHSTRLKMEKHLPNCHIYSSNAHAEGVNLAHLEHFIIVNSDYSGAKFLQRRERITNMNRTSEAVVHHIITTGGVSQKVYEALSNKRDFNLATFRGIRNARKFNSKADSKLFEK